jgi:flagellar biosynthesis/type III secretory pathway protein FliH
VDWKKPAKLSSQVQVKAMPSSHNIEFPESKKVSPKSWIPEEFTSVPRASIFAAKPSKNIEPMTLEKIGWSEEIPSFVKSKPVEKSSMPITQSSPRNVSTWQMPDISQFAIRKDDDIPVVHQPGVNTALDYAQKIKEDAEEEAERIINEARSRAAEIEASAQNHAEERRQQAYLDGMEASREEAAAILKSAQTVLEEAHIWKQKTMAESEPAVIEMIKSISQDLFGEGYKLNVQEIEGVITRAISQASRLGDLRIYMNPEDARQIIALWQESEIVLNGQKIALVSSQNIEPGGCFIDGQYGMVDSRVTEQLGQIHKSLEATLADSVTEEPLDGSPAQSMSDESQVEE